MALEVACSKLVARPIFYIGVSPSGKARDFDSRIRRFKSCHPSQKASKCFCTLEIFFYDGSAGFVDEDGFPKTAQCAVLPSEISERILKRER